MLMKLAANVSMPMTLRVEPLVNNQKDVPDNIAKQLVTKIHYIANV